jgi:predicted phosphodiesterase
MRVAILSDVHANLEALTAVLEELDRQYVDRILFLGDAVGYGADPERCIEVLAKAAHRAIAGNHDTAVASDGESLASFRHEAASAVRWTRDMLTQETRDGLRAMPLECIEDGMHLVHGSPHVPGRWQYVLSRQDAEKAFSACNSGLILVGHSHIPSAFVEVECRRLFTGVTRRIEARRPDSIRIEPRYRYLLNVGSVGQPRDGGPACVVRDLRAGHRRVHAAPSDVRCEEGIGQDPEGRASRSTGRADSVRALT